MHRANTFDVVDDVRAVYSRLASALQDDGDLSSCRTRTAAVIDAASLPEIVVAIPNEILFEEAVNVPSSNAIDMAVNPAEDSEVDSLTLPFVT